MENVRTAIEPAVRPFLDLRTDGGEISDFCRRSGQPIILTEEGAEDLVLMSREAYENMELYRIYALLGERMEEIRDGRGIPARESYEKLKAEMEAWNNIA